MTQTVTEKIRHTRLEGRLEAEACPPNVGGSGQPAAVSRLVVVVVVDNHTQSPITQSYLYLAIYVYVWLADYVFA